MWEPGGSQPDNSHQGSTEIFVFLAGRGIAHSDEHSVPVGPGDVLILPRGSVHHIENTSTAERMYAVTIMTEDTGALPGGFAELVNSGTRVAWDDIDRAALGSAQP